MQFHPIVRYYDGLADVVTCFVLDISRDRSTGTLIRTVTHVYAEQHTQVPIYTYIRVHNYIYDPYTRALVHTRTHTDTNRQLISLDTRP